MDEKRLNGQGCAVYGIGQCSLDYLGTVLSYPAPDTKSELQELVTQGGGPVATALVALSRWGISCAFAGVVGDDEYGVRIRNSLTAEGVDLGGMVVRKGHESQVAFIVVEPGTGGRRTVYWRRPTGSALAPDEVDYSFVTQARVVHTDGFYPHACLAACHAAKRAGAQVVVDAGSMREGMLEIARMSDCFLASHTFARALVGEESDAEACREIARYGPRVVGVTRGAKGYVALAEGALIERPAYPVRAIDTTGCGDVFHGGFIYGLVQGWAAGECLDFGAWAAAKVSTRLGGRGGIPKLPRVDRDEAETGGGGEKGGKSWA